MNRDHSCTGSVFSSPLLTSAQIEKADSKNVVEVVVGSNTMFGRSETANNTELSVLFCIDISHSQNAVIIETVKTFQIINNKCRIIFFIVRQEKQLRLLLQYFSLHFH